MMNNRKKPIVQEKVLATPQKIGSHVPSPSKCLSPQRDGKPHDLPADEGKVLIGYKESWSANFFETKDHNDAIQLLRHQRAAPWDFFNEVDEMVVVVQASALWDAIKYAQNDFDMVQPPPLLRGILSKQS